jgi:hypothetical protein
MSQSSASSPGRGDRRFLLLVGAALVAISVVLYLVNYFIFRDGRNLIFYLLIDLAFLPIEVLIVGVIVERLIAIRDKSAIAQKLNMVIGAFFSELGTPLLARLLPTMDAAPEIRERLHLKASWKKEDFSRASQFARTLQGEVDLSRVDLYDLKSYMLEKRDRISSSTTASPTCCGRSCTWWTSSRPGPRSPAFHPPTKRTSASTSAGPTTPSWRSGSSTWST